MATSTDNPLDIEKSAIDQRETKHVDGESKDSSNAVDAYASPENTTWKTWVVIFVRACS
jgi:hypothetical protein